MERIGSKKKLNFEKKKDIRLASRWKRVGPANPIAVVVVVKCEKFLFFFFLALASGKKFEF